MHKNSKEKKTRHKQENPEQHVKQIRRQSFHCFMLTTVTKIWILIRAIKLERNAMYKNEHSMNYLSNKNEIRMSM